MNPSTAQATVLVDELVRNDVRQVVVCPGSRNAPLSMALHEAAEQGRITLHVRIDERSAGFFALGLARGLAHRPHRRGFAAVVCTSGTAVANLHPAVLEAQLAGVALLLITADRPAELVGTGANQTVRQHGIFGPEVSIMDFPLAERIPGRNQVWRGLVCRAVATADTNRPVQLNIPFREPLVPTKDTDGWPDSLDGRPAGARWTAWRPGTLGSWGVPGAGTGQLVPRTVMVVGDTDWNRVFEAAQVAAHAGWPVIAEPVSAGAAAGAADVLRHGAVLLNAGLAERLVPDAVVVVGRPTLSRGVQRLLAAAPAVHVVDNTPQWTDAQHVATSVSGWLSTDDLDFAHGDGDQTIGEWLAGNRDNAWLDAWQAADDAAGGAVDAVLADTKWPTGLHVARDLVDALPPHALLFVGSSNPIRDLDLVAAPRADVLVFANRGVAGIDGSVSTAVGLTLGAAAADDRTGPGYALLGDLTFLHDANGLLIGPGEQRPDLTVVVLNDNGGGIFSLLEQGADAHVSSFERVFGTPHGADLAALCAAHGVPHVLAANADEFTAALSPAAGLRVIEVRADRSVLRDLHARLRTAVQARTGG